MVIFGKDGEQVAISADTTNTESPLNVLLIGGIPLNEPVARYGPFVMNTKEEILQASQDYRDGKIGIIYL
jgi:quercetin 2,3-dioxygenase